MDHIVSCLASGTLVYSSLYFSCSRSRIGCFFKGALVCFEETVFRYHSVSYRGAVVGWSLFLGIFFVTRLYWYFLLKFRSTRSLYNSKDAICTYSFPHAKNSLWHQHYSFVLLYCTYTIFIYNTSTTTENFFSLNLHSQMTNLKSFEIIFV